MAVVRVLWWFGLVCWSVAAVWHFTRPPSLWLLDVVVQPLTVVLYVFGFGAVVVGLAVNRRRETCTTAAPYRCRCDSGAITQRRRPLRNGVRQSRRPR